MCARTYRVKANTVQFLKTSWLADRDQLARDAPSITDADLEDAMTYGDESLPQRQEDDMMMDDGPDDDDLEAMVASYEQDGSMAQRPESPSFSDDDYDDIFADFMSHDHINPSQVASQLEPSDAMQLSQDMTF